MFSLDSDTLWKSSIRRQIGFDFTIKEEDRKIIVTDATTGLQTWAIKPQGLMNEKAIDNLVRACLRLKKKHDEAITK